MAINGFVCMIDSDDKNIFGSFYKQAIDKFE